MSKKMEETKKSELGFDLGDTSIELKEVPTNKVQEETTERTETSTPRINILRNGLHVNASV